MSVPWSIFLSVAILSLLYAKTSQGLDIKIKLKKWLLKITIREHNATVITETQDTTLQLPENDKKQWETLRGTMRGNSSDENIDNTTSLFDRILVTNAFRRSESNDGNYLYQGDILVNNHTLWLSGQNNDRKKRAVVAFNYFRWDEAEGIPYKLHPSLNDNARRVILSAMREWERALPCLKWRVKTDFDQSFIHFFQGQGCYSQVGRVGGEQSLSIGRGCEMHGIALHEMGHALGLFHEQSRPDRDDYVKIIKENILEGFDSQFEKFDKDTINSFGVPYDYGSIMHYSATAFAKERGLETIKSRGRRDVAFGQRDHLSEDDVKQANAMYGCRDTEFIATPVTAMETTSQTLSTTEEQTNRTTKVPFTYKGTSTVEPTYPSTEKPTTLPSTTEREIPATEVTTEEASGLPTSEVIFTEPLTNAQTTDAVTDTLETEAVTSATTDVVDTSPITMSPAPTTTLPTEARTDALTTDELPAEVSSTKKPSGASTMENPSTKSATSKSPICTDILSDCHRYIRKGYCSPSSSQYCTMKYFCGATCEMWRNSELSRGAKCVDLLPECATRAAYGACSRLHDREYMENMCCSSCNRKLCEDQSVWCSLWAGIGGCRSSQYVQENCKKTCTLCGK